MQTVIFQCLHHNFLLLLKDCSAHTGTLCLDIYMKVFTYVYFHNKKRSGTLGGISAKTCKVQCPIELSSLT